MFDKDKFAAHLDSQAPGTTSSYHCAKYVREALQAAGIDTQHHPIPAKDYGPYLEQWGFEPISPPSHPEKGDIAVIQPNPAGVRDRAPWRGVELATSSRSPARLAGFIRLPRRAT